MSDNGLGFLPKDLPPELSRGHPLLFSFIYGASYSLFGDNIVVGHIISLIISIVLLISVYFICKIQYSKLTGLLSVMLIIAQTIFFAQSVLVLPEICLAVFIIWSIHFWAIGKYGLYALFSSLAILTKETAVIIPVAIIAAELLLYISRNKNSIKFKIKPSQVLIITPFIIFGIFLLIQKMQNGWYLFPLHKNNIGFNIQRLINFSRDFCILIFYEQGRIVMSGVAAIVLTYSGVRKQFRVNRFSVFLIMLVLGGIIFSALNFFMNRYLIFVIIPLVILFSAIIIEYSKQFPTVILIIPVIVICCIYTFNGAYLIGKKDPSLNWEERFDYDENMQYVDYLSIQKDAVDYVLNLAGPNDKIFSNFPLVYSFLDTRHGFTEKKIGLDFHIQITRAHQKGFQFALIAEPGSYDYHLPDADSLNVIKVFEGSVAKITIYTPK